MLLFRDNVDSSNFMLTRGMPLKGLFQLVKNNDYGYGTCYLVA